MRLAEGWLDFEGAKAYCDDLLLRGHTDWTIPSPTDFEAFLNAPDELETSWREIFGGDRCLPHRSTMMLHTTRTEGMNRIFLNCPRAHIASMRWASQPTNYRGGVLCMRHSG